jgi:hypothetical protein
VIADFDSLDKPPALFSFRSMSRDHLLTVEHFQFSSRQSGAACQGSYDAFFEAALEKMGTKTQSKTVCYYLSLCLCVFVSWWQIFFATKGAKIIINPDKPGKNDGDDEQSKRADYRI